jgi:hypothetical protein
LKSKSLMLPSVFATATAPEPSAMFTPVMISSTVTSRLLVQSPTHAEAVMGVVVTAVSIRIAIAARASVAGRGGSSVDL